MEWSEPQAPTDRLERTMDQPTQATQLLIRLGAGDPDAPELLLDLLYAELHRLASSYMARERDNHTLQATALVSEAFVKLFDRQKVEWSGRKHFYAVAAKAMRHLLVDQARRRKRIVCVDQTDLGSLMVVHAEEQETAALSGAQL